jgi:hypothetical protein
MNDLYSRKLETMTNIKQLLDSLTLTYKYGRNNLSPYDVVALEAYVNTHLRLLGEECIRTASLDTALLEQQSND